MIVILKNAAFLQQIGLNSVVLQMQLCKSTYTTKLTTKAHTLKIRISQVTKHFIIHVLINLEIHK